jgi:hypothetical protein
VISFPYHVPDLREFRERQKLLIDMLAINMSVLHEKVRTLDGKFVPRVTYLCDCQDTYYYPVLGARIENGRIEVQINVTAPEWHPVLKNELIVDSFDVLVYSGSEDENFGSTGKGLLSLALENAFEHLVKCCC